MFIEYGSLILGTILGITIGVISMLMLNMERISNKYLKFNEILEKLEELEVKIQKIENNFNRNSKDNDQEELDELKLELRALNEEIQKIFKKET